MHVASLSVEVRLRSSHSLKDKRSMLRPVVEGARRRFSVAAAEVGHQDSWQRAVLGFATVSSSATHAEEVLDGVERFVWSFPELDVIASRRDWMTAGESQG
jgi:uncharacterized protein YlxP (DUF503 family)